MGKDCVCSKTNAKKQISNVRCEAILAGFFTKNDGTQFTATMSATGTGNTCHDARAAAQKSILQTLKEYLENNKNVNNNPSYTITTSCDGDCDPQQVGLTTVLNGTLTWKKTENGFYVIEAQINQQDGLPLIKIGGTIFVDGDQLTPGQNFTMNIFPVPFKCVTEEKDGLAFHTERMFWLGTKNNSHGYRASIPLVVDKLDFMRNTATVRFVFPQDVELNYGPATVDTPDQRIGHYILNNLLYYFHFEDTPFGDSGTRQFDVTLRGEPVVIYGN